MVAFWRDMLSHCTYKGDNGAWAGFGTQLGVFCMYNIYNSVRYQATGLRDSDELMFSIPYKSKVGKECVNQKEENEMKQKGEMLD